MKERDTRQRAREARRGRAPEWRALRELHRAISEEAQAVVRARGAYRTPFWSPASLFFIC